MDRVLPDGAEALRELLQAVTPLTQLVGTRVGITLQSTEPAIRLTLQGGNLAYEEGTPLVLVESWGRSNAPDDGSASLIARRLVAAAPSMRGPVTDGVVLGVAVEGGVSSSPDAQTRRPRALMSVRLVVGPAT